jgi:hypothetical protein
MKEDSLAFPELDEWKFSSFMAKSRSLTVMYIGTTKAAGVL